MRLVLQGMVLLLPLLSCATARVPEVVGEPVVDPASVVAELRARTLPPGLMQVNFAWTLEEGGSRVRGRGVVRVDAPERIRLDLFGPRGETVLIAALAGSEYHLPRAVTSPVPLPSPALLWAALGIFEPPIGAQLTSATVDGETTELRYQTADANLYLFTFSAYGGVPGLVRLERAASRGVVESVTVSRDSAGAVGSSEYRDWTAFRNLTLEPESTRSVDSFPSDIWRPDA